MSGDQDGSNRGHAIEIGHGGDAKGSGAGAGGGGGPEDYDADEASGSRAPDLPVDKSNVLPSHN